VTSRSIAAAAITALALAACGGGGVLFRALARPAGRRGNRQQVARGGRPWRERPRAVTPAHHPAGRERPAQAGNGLHRPLLRAQPRSRHPVGTNAFGVRRPGAAGQAAVRGAVQPSGLAAHARVVDRRRPAAARPSLRPGEIQPHRPGARTRVGASLPTVRAVHRAVLSAEIGRTVERLSQDWGLRPHQVSLAWLLSRPAVASAIVGAETVEEITANASVADVVLEQAQLDALTTLRIGTIT
jgi:Aldo/keto reductase family